ncbi:hypothetical protein AX14_002608 [Amanita brunnescens Koide BX004]|nr:hypothetical protein AX14_002608 [Amanita brunnescens Koide BX004]
MTSPHLLWVLKAEAKVHAAKGREGIFKNDTKPEDVKAGDLDMMPNKATERRQSYSHDYGKLALASCITSTRNPEHRKLQGLALCYVV